MKSRRFIAVGASVCALALMAVPISASAAPGDGTVDLRQNVYSAWVNSTLTVSSSALTMPSGWDNAVSSLWVWSPVDTIKLYENSSYTGLTVTFIYGTDDLRDYGFNDITSSYKLTW